MSWQEYVDTHLVGTGKITQAAIIGQAGGVWATSSGFNLSTAEQAAVIKVFKDPAAAQASGVRLAGRKFFTLQVDDQKLYGKQGQGGCTIVKTKQAVIVAVYEAPTLAGEANVVAEKLGDYLISSGY